MLHPISWSDLPALAQESSGSTPNNEHPRIGVWGLGVEGQANLARLQQLGITPVIVDDQPVETHTADGIPILRTHEGGLDALLKCTVVIKAPGISILRDEVHSLNSRGVHMVNGLGLWLADVDRHRVIAVTGTKGKSTTTSILDHLARKLGFNTFLGGNIGVPPWDPALALDDAHIDMWIIEVSSYQAASLQMSAPLTVVTSLAPDHLPWHGTEEQYYNDKLSLTSRPGAAVTIASRADKNLQQYEHLLGGEVRWVDANTYPESWSEGLKLLGPHNHINANLARAALETFCDLEQVWPAHLQTPHLRDQAMENATHGFVGLAHRLEHIGNVGAVQFIDDGLSTNVLPTLAAVAAFPGQRIALIAGGFDRQLDYGTLARGLNKLQQPIHVITVFTTGPVIAEAVRNVQLQDSSTGSDPVSSSAHLTTSAAANLEDAVNQAYEFARPDGVVLLSPAAASFDAFRDYQHRSDVFRDAVAKLQSASKSL